MDDINVPKTNRQTAAEIAAATIANLNKPRQTFVYEGAEVYKTGRVASKTLGSGKKDQVVEITPTQTTTGSWKKWVSEAHLYEIEE